MTGLLTYCLFLSLFCPCAVCIVSNASEQVINRNFVTIVNNQKTLHFVTDNFRLTQQIDLKPIVVHLKEIQVGFKKIKAKISEGNVSLSQETNLEERTLSEVVEHVAQTIASGLQLLPQARICNLRKKRSSPKVRQKRMDFEVDRQPVGNFALFPSVGRIFSYITGNLNADAADVINKNYNNIKHLAKASAKFAHMLNASLQIEIKHDNQIRTLSEQVRKLKENFNRDITDLEMRVKYSNIIHTMTLIALDLQTTVERVFENTDKAEYGRLGTFARDRVLLDTIINIMNYDVKMKKNALYLMKIGSNVRVSACKWIIFIQYKFPILDPRDFVPYKLLSIPKKVNDNYFVLKNIPNTVTWSDEMYALSKEDLKGCRIVDTDLLCKRPETSQLLKDSCIYGIINYVKWEDLAPKCQIEQVKNPEDIIKITQSHMIYFFKEEEYVNILCKNYTKPLVLIGSGSVKIPSGCKIKYRGTESFSLGHISRTDNVKMNLDNSVYYQDFKDLIKLFEFPNKTKDISTVVNIENEKEIINNGLSEVDEIMGSFQFSQTAIHITLFSLITYTVLATVFMIGILICVCRPDRAIFCKKCCCGCIYEKPEGQVNKH